MHLRLSLLRRAALGALLVLTPGHASAQALLHTSADDLRQAWVDSVMATLTPRQQLGQLVMPQIVTTAHTKLPAARQEMAQMLRRYHVGGFIYSKVTMLAQAELDNYAQRESHRLQLPPALIAIDGEWGIVRRLTDATPFPDAAAIGRLTPAALRDSLCYRYGREMARQLALLGVHVNLAPVVDINSNPANPVIGRRAFGTRADTVIHCALAYAHGLEDGGILSVAKHFPGHGDTDTDSHRTLPHIAHPRSTLWMRELRPFQAYIDAGLGGVMVAHLDVPALSGGVPDLPASVCPAITTDLLRGQMGFEGLVITDGMAMRGVSDRPDAAVEALIAGNDILLQPTPFATQMERLQQALTRGYGPYSADEMQALVADRCRRVLAWKYALIVARQHDLADCAPADRGLPLVDTRDLQRRLCTDYAAQLSAALSGQGAADLPGLDPTLQMLAAGSATPGPDAPDATDPTLADLTTAEGGTSPADGGIGPTAGPADGPGAGLGLASDAADAQSTGASPTAALSDGSGTGASPTAAASRPYVATGPAPQLPRRLPPPLSAESEVAVQYAAPDAAYDGAPRADRLAAMTEAIDELVIDALVRQAMPGCQVLVAHRGHIVYDKAWGWLDPTRSQPVSLATLYDLASVTKAAATLVAVMLCVDRHDVRLSDRLDRYLPQLRTTPLARLTLRQLLLHESGLPEGHPFYRMAIDPASIADGLFRAQRTDVFSRQQDASVWFNRGLRWDPRWMRADGLPVAHGMSIDPAFRDSMLARLSRLKLKPAGHYRYSDLNFVLLRHVVEAASGLPIDTLLYRQLPQFYGAGGQRLVYQPLLHGVPLDRIAPTEQDDALRRQLLRGYVHDETAAFSGGVEGNAGLFGSAHALFPLLQTLLQHGRWGADQLISERTAQTFLTDKSRTSRRGLGFDKPETDPARKAKSPCGQLASPLTVGHTGYTGTCFWIDPRHDLVYIFLSNRVCPHRWNRTLMTEDYRTRIQDEIYKAIP